MENNELKTPLLCRKCGNIGNYICSGCKNVIYCSKKCQFDDWSKHKSECINNSKIQKENRKEIRKKMSKTLTNKNNTNNNSNYNTNNSSYINNNNSNNNSNYNNNNKNFINNNQVNKINVNNSNNNISNDIDSSFNMSILNKNNIVYPISDVKSFDFLQKISIIKQGGIDHSYILYHLINKHRKFILENNLFHNGENNDDKPFLYLYKNYLCIENYIYHYLLLIKYYCVSGNKENIKKGNLTFIQISKEILEGILSYTINYLIKKCSKGLNYKKNLQIVSFSRLILSSYIKIISLLIKYSDYFNNQKLFFKYLNSYGSLNETILLSSNLEKINEKNMLRSNLYFNIGNFYIKKDYFSIGITLLKKSISIQKSIDQYSHVAISSMFNISLLYYIMDNLKDSENYIMQAIEKLKILKSNTSKPIYKEILNELLVKFLIFYAELNIEIEKYDDSIEELKEALQIIIKEDKKYNRSITSNDNNYNSINSINDNNNFSKNDISDNYILEYVETIELERSTPRFKLKKTQENERYKSIINGLFDKIMYIKNEINSQYNFKNDNHYLRSLTLKNEKENRNSFIFDIKKNNPLFLNDKNSEKILTYLNDNIIRKKHYLDLDNLDFKNFFLLLTKLTPHQINLLNKTQNSKMPMSLFKNLPIFFSKQFKNSLNPNQRILLDNLNILSLVRCKILNDVNKQISINNLNYKLVHNDIQFDDFDIKKYSQLKEIINEVMKKEKPYRRYAIKLPSQIKKNIKYMTLSSDSNESEDESLSDDKIFVFKYDEEYNLDNFRNKVIQYIEQNYMIYSQEEIELLIKIIKSNIFINTLNQLSLNEIKDLENQPEIISNLFYEQIKDGNLLTLNNEKEIINSKNENEKNDDKINSKIFIKDNNNEEEKDNSEIILKNSTISIKKENSISYNQKIDNEDYISNKNKEENILFENENNISTINQYIKTSPNVSISHQTNEMNLEDDD